MTEAEQPDPLAPVCAVVASELLGLRATTTRSGTSPGGEMTDRYARHVVDDDLEDEVFEARIARPRPRATTPTSEGATTEEVLRSLNTRPAHRFQKMHQGAHSGSGEPDLDGCVHGRCVKIEMKAPGKRPSTKQNRRLLQWQEAGALVGWARSLDEVDQILDRIDDPTYRYTGQPGAPAPGAPPAPEDARDQYSTDTDDPDPPAGARHPALSRRHRAVGARHSRPTGRSGA